jgi:S-DNA-T family DNA segregation ATPase FtsK/SpoIIIE
VVLTSAASIEEVSVGVDAILRLDGETGDTGTLTRAGQPDRSVTSVDRLAPAIASRFARDLAALAPTDSATTLPRAVRLLDLPSAGLRLDPGDRIAGAWSTARNRLDVVLGRTADRTVELDLCRAGPHALVAGTTGSGKSELLQTLIASLALNHPPERCSFLLVDYKGGAAFAEAADLPHTVGVVTDLDGQKTARALRSLAAELTRREAILAAHQVADLADLPDDVDLARLVIVVDEFATLAEELPAFVPGLVSIAQRGRSLGIHLVLATQRPAGVVSPEIRANCSLRICLRTTDEADSRDVLGVPAAAQLPIDIPGRAFVRTGGGTPIAVQIARVAGGAAADDDGPEAARWVWPLPAIRPSQAPDPDRDLLRITKTINGQARAIGTRLPHRPWRPALPERLAAAELPELPTPGATRLALGLLDLPDRQAQEVLELDLTDGGTWLVVGGARSGRSTLLRSVLHAAVRSLGPDDLHVHVIESGGGTLATDAIAFPHTGTAISGEDPHRSVRLVDRLAEEVVRRRAAREHTRRPHLLLLIDGVDELTGVLESADPGQGAATLTRLLRDGGAAGLTCIVTADRAVPGGRLAGLARTRLVLPLPDRADYSVAGIPPRAVPERRPPGRALVGEEALECQLALPQPLEAGTAWPAAGGVPPLRIPDLPADPVLSLPRDPGAGLRLPVGPGGDEGSVLVVDLARTGGLLVAGPPGSGRSTTLQACEAHLSAAGVPLLRLRRASDEAEVRAWVSGLGGRPGVVLADDVGTPTDWPALASLPTTAGVALIAAAHAAQLSAHYQGPVAALRRARVGLLLRPGPGDADLLGVRLPRTPVPARPGSGWLVSGGTAERVQVARRREPGG